MMRVRIRLLLLRLIGDVSGVSDGVGEGGAGAGLPDEEDTGVISAANARVELDVDVAGGVINKTSF